MFRRIDRLLTVLLEDRDRPLDVHAELRVLLARGQIGVGLVFDIRIHPQSGVHFRVRALRVPLRQAAEVLQFLFRFDVEAPDAGLQGTDDLLVGLAHAGVDHFREVGPRLLHAVQLPAADDVEAAALLGHEPQDVDIAASLDREADGRVELGIRLLHLLQVVEERAFTVDVGGRADLGCDSLDVHVFREQSAAFVTK